MELLALKLRIETAIDKAVITGRDTTDLEDIYKHLLTYMYEQKESI